MIERPPTLMTWQSGSMRTTGVSVERHHLLVEQALAHQQRAHVVAAIGRRSCCELVVMRSALVTHSRGDDRADVFAIRGRGSGCRAPGR